MRLTRRTLLAAAAAIPAAVGLDRLAAAAPGAGIMLYDGRLPNARQRAFAASGWSAELVEISGDRVRFARDIVARRPAAIHGLSRQADALLIEEVAAEAGYRQVLNEVRGDAIAWSLVPR